MWRDFLSIRSWRNRGLAIPEISSILPLNEQSGYEYLEVLYLAELILHEVWLALFEIHHSLDWYNRIPNDWNQVVSEDHEQDSRENLLCILAVALQILPLRCSSRNDFIKFSGLESLNRGFVVSYNLLMF